MTPIACPTSISVPADSPGFTAGRRRREWRLLESRTNRAGSPRPTGTYQRYNEGMRVCLCLLALAVCSLSAADKPKTETVRGKLVVGSGQTPAIETPEHKLIQLDGDQPTRKTLHDPRV